jgi:V/A-type H+-transporting ATPase subunit I
MSIVPMQKVSLLVHRSDQEELVRQLQNDGLLHISDLKESSLAEDFPDLVAEDEITDESLEELCSQLTWTIGTLSEHGESEGLLQGFLGARTILTPEALERTVAGGDPASLIDETRTMERSYAELRSRETQIHSQIEFLLPWTELDLPLSEIASTPHAAIIPCIIPDPAEFDALFGAIPDLPLHVEIITRTPENVYCIICYTLTDEERAKEALVSVDYETLDFEAHGLVGNPRELIAQYEAELHEIDLERATLESRARELAGNLPTLKVFHDHYQSLLDQRRIENFALSTRESVLIVGWTPRIAYPRLERSIARFSHVSLATIEPEPGESPPTVLSNRSPLRPFEVVTELYGMPHQRELDPTPLLAPFFALFFGLCLTDAGYGVLLAFLVLLLMRKVQGDPKLLKLLLWGAAATVVMGAITGGWFGDAVDRLPFEFLKTARNRLRLFDPFESPMIFFGLSVGLGYIHCMFGRLVELYDNLRQRRIQDALFGPLTWLVLINSILFGALSLTGLVPRALARPLFALAVLGAVSAIGFSAREEPNPAFRIIMGGINFYMGLTGFVGDTLSYVRLMALGMVTAGIAMAFNTIAGMIGAIPFVGIVLAILVLIAAHHFNLAINVLGAFVHTLRLQFVEFFPKFYEAGGTIFRPFAREAKYTIVDRSAERSQRARSGRCPKSCEFPEVR